MLRKRNTKVHNIFCIDTLKIEAKYFNSTQQTIDTIINKLLVDKPSYKPQTQKENINCDPFQVQLFFCHEKKRGNKLASFCEVFIEAGQKVLTFRALSASSILFIWSANHLYAITTGQAFRIVEDFCVPYFGMQVTSIFNKFKITALDSNEMASIIHSTKTIYSNEIDFINVDNLDTVFKEVTGRLTDTSTVHQLLDLDQTSKKKSMKVTAKNSVQFGSAVDFKGLLRILNYIDNFDFAQLTDKFNLIIPLQANRQQPQINNNNKIVCQKIYEALKDNTKSGFDLFHKNTNDFIEAESYTIYTKENSDFIEKEDFEPDDFIKEAYELYCEDKVDNLELFIDFAQNTKIDALKDGFVITSDPLLKHISGEINVDDKNYYVFYGQYFLLNSGYSDRLNKTLNGKLRSEIFLNIVQEPWRDGDIEDTFNERASSNKDYIHLHKIKPDYIEFADLLKIDGDMATIVHVKDGFDGTMRELERQIELSFMQIFDLKSNNNREYFEKLYINASAQHVGKNIQTVFSTQDTFIEKMRDCNFRYVMLLHVEDKNLLNSRSNIAKHCLNSLLLKCFNKGIELKIDLI